MDKNVPVFQFSAWSGTGKTTLIEKLIPLLKAKGLRVGVIKHDAHDFEIDHEGKDSYRFAKAGADITVLNSKEKTALIIQHSLDFLELYSMLNDVDLILAEGYNDLDAASLSLPFYRIGISRRSANKDLRLASAAYDLVVSDEEYPNVDNAFLKLDDIQGIASWILEHTSSSFADARCC